MSATSVLEAPAAVAPSPAASAGTNALAIASLVLGLCGFALLPVILGHVALGQIRRRGEGGAGLAIVGVVLGYLALVAYIVAAIVIASLAVWAISSR